jgi:hypothetical protein
VASAGRTVTVVEGTSPRLKSGPTLKAVHMKATAAAMARTPPAIAIALWFPWNASTVG